ncbi:melanocortin receptor 4-like [Mercenaria mercenaria]|uniref:melanocortin receptor 4-like n=1 Tax=Mercenaria mercenaria TaxID=6596 RepID=UPI00234E56E1|nr:melanocortin receptor 4-like [Mercenaria mercenaria]XP_053374383.1 melanocortin receptor 4-like [Mercenaria mercenaria]
MESNTTDVYVLTSQHGMYAKMSMADKAIEIFTKPIEVTSLIICILGLIANCLSIMATAHIPHGQSTHSKLIISLGISDSLILVAILSHNLMYIFSSWDDCTKMTKRLMLDIALLATLINLLVMAIDHYLAIMKPLHYRRFMSNFRGNCLIVFIWLFSVTTGLIELIVGFTTSHKDQPLCMMVSADEFDMELIIIGLIFFVLLAIVVIYMRIYILVKTLMKRDRMMHQDEMHSYKAIVTTMLIIGTFTLFWAPAGIFQIYMYMKIKTDMFFVMMHIDKFTLANDVLFLILQVNSLADPLIYAIRLCEVQRGYKVVFYKLCPNYRSSRNEEEFRHHHLSFTSYRRDTDPTIMNDTVSSPDSFHDKVFGKEFEGKSDEAAFILERRNDTNKSCGNRNGNYNNTNTDNVKASDKNTSQVNNINSDDVRKNEKETVNNNVANTEETDTAFAYVHNTMDSIIEDLPEMNETDPLNPKHDKTGQNL